MRKLRKVIIIFCLLILYLYFCNNHYFPNKIIVKENSKVQFSLCPLLKVKGISQTSTSSDYYKLELSFLGIKVKESNVEVIEDVKLIPVGQIAGIRLYTKGVMIVGVSGIQDINGIMRKSIDEESVCEGDRIISINGLEINNIQDLKNQINKNLNDLKLVIEDVNGNLKNIKVTPIQTGENEYKIGLWVKDAATGIGTITYYNPQNNNFAALGHGIIDKDTEKILNIDTGEVTNADIISINKAIPGSPR